MGGSRRQLALRLESEPLTSRLGDKGRPVVRATPPDIVMLAVDWQPRALIRAQLIEEGFHVVATNTWPMMRRSLRPGSKPGLAVVDLQNLTDARDVLHELRVLMKPCRVLVLGASGPVTPKEIERMGFRVVSRPILIRDVVAAARAVTSKPRGSGR